MSLNIASILLWGFVATLVLTTILSASQGLRLTRMSIPLMLGALLSADLDRMQVYGFTLHFMNGWLFSLLYGLIFEDIGRSGGLLGAAMGLGHGLFLLAVLMPVLPSIHPRMAGEYQQPKPTVLLEPPGFMALNYGIQTPVITLAAHVAYGLILGTFYQLTGGGT